MSDSISWELEAAALAGSMVGLRCRTLFLFPMKAYVVTVDGPDQQSFLDANRSWHFSESLGKPFIYVPEMVESPSIADLGKTHIPAETTAISLRLQNWGKNYTAASIGFDVLIVDTDRPDGSKTSHYLERSKI